MQTPIPPAKKKLKTSAFRIALACWLGIFSGAISWLAPANTLIGLIVTFYRVPLLWFCASFVLAKFVVLKYLAGHLSDWGLGFLTSRATLPIAERIVRAPVLCYMNLTDTINCGATLVGFLGGLGIGLIVFALVRLSRKREKESDTPP